ncbi:hypothetical protein [Candidatus Riesia pediculicola]|uniref:Uncharacterized protein n=1 Tax=Riesia pediculicola (strain USDA) TaxID=515618 RepID=D4G7X7_RIEPU|nr:hypothetical protein [Candidatus Riesia pediculicola]ADD79754.1 hypothetical protein RIEPE_0169 [Candidatus Riesia pediculicola USDA]ARC53692.1 hypothetical protein AOE55_00775 [Candidatus Riesia pediculicola]
MIIFISSIARISIHFLVFLNLKLFKEKIYKISFLMFFIIISFILSSGSLWIMHHLRTNMSNQHETLFRDN